jgi:hypothetical protein
MQLIRHLNDEELTELLLEGDQRELQPALGSLPDWLRSNTDQPEWFWQRQRAAIRGRIATAERSRFRASLAWAGTLALSVVALLLLNGSPQSHAYADANRPGPGDAAVRGRRGSQRRSGSAGACSAAGG